MFQFSRLALTYLFYLISSFNKVSLLGDLRILAYFQLPEEFRR